MSWIQRERVRFIDEYERTYGKRPSEDDEMLPIMHFIFSAGKATQAKLADTEKLILKLEESINDSSKITNSPTYNFSDGEAMKWQIGIALKILIVISGFTALGWSIYFWWDANDKVEKADKIVLSAPVIEEKLLPQIQIDGSGYYFLEFKRPQKSSVNFFTEYHLMNDGSVRVYLSKKK